MIAFVFGEIASASIPAFASYVPSSTSTTTGLRLFWIIGLTVVGKPLTELFRLESISWNERINYFVKYKYIVNWNANINSDTYWELEEIQDLPDKLKGVDYTYVQTNKYWRIK